MPLLGTARPWIPNRRHAMSAPCEMSQAEVVHVFHLNIKAVSPKHSPLNQDLQ
jgi:hypothetical protein